MEFEVHVTKIDQGEVTNLIYGYVLYGDEKLKFRAIAYGRYGGQNIYPKIGKKTKERIKELGEKLEEFESDLQRKLIEGDLIVHTSGYQD